MKPYVSKSLKLLNREAVYEFIRCTRHLTRTDAVEKTGISAPTMMKIFEYFVEIGLLREGGEQGSKLGRRANLYDFVPDSFYTLAIELCHNDITIFLLNLNHRVIQKQDILIETDWFSFFRDQLPTIIPHFLEEIGAPLNRILGVGISCPTVVDPDNILHFAPLAGINKPTDMNLLLRKLEREIGLPILLENDTNASAVGEFVTRDMCNQDNLVFVTVNRGLGSGIVLKGELWRGQRRIAGEIGYMVFDDGFQNDKTKPGWIEDAIMDELSYIVKKPKKNIRFMCQGASEKEKQQIIDRISPYISLIIANSCAVLDVELVILGGGVAELLGAPFLQTLKTQLTRLTLSEIKLTSPYCQYPAAVGMGALLEQAYLEKILGQDDT